MRIYSDAEAGQELATVLDEADSTGKVFIRRRDGRNWRRGRDSNPRYSFPYTRFPSVLLKPLGHLSDAENPSREFYFLGRFGTRPRPG